ncbi:MAG: ribulose-phosphate 3-epimerase [Candidatus Nitrosocaldaceae archaeon]
MILIAPSIIAADLADLKNAVIMAEKGNADLIHLDVMDGNFVPNITFGFSTIKALRKYTNILFDTHLMISNPLKYVDNFINAGSDIITVHIEVCNAETLREIIDKINDKGKKAGIALNPNTDFPEWVIEMLDAVYLLNIMSVYPGFSGQKLIPETLIKMKRVHEMIKELGLKTVIEADGGVEENNIAEVIRAGAEIIVAGNAIYSKNDIPKAIRDLRFNAQLALKEAA